MIRFFTEISKYLMIILFAIYTFECFYVMLKKDIKKRRAIFFRQYFYMVLIHLCAYGVIFANTSDTGYIFMFVMQEVLLFVIQLVFQLFYRQCSKLVLNNMCMLLCIGFIIIGRLDPDKAFKQFIFAIIATVIAGFIPLLVKKLKFLSKIPILYAIIGIIALAAVALSQTVTYGAKLTFTLGPVTIQPSEFVKILFVFFVASIYQKATNFRRVLVTTIIAAIHVGILVISKDLGAAVILFITYLVMLYVASQNVVYLGAGLGVGVVGSIGAYKLFSHVRVRVEAFLDPLKNVQTSGYQVSQALFAIGMGSWFGTGLMLGQPKSIPVSEEDFVFAAISEEMGLIFAICLVMLVVATYITFLNIALQINDMFYKLIALGLGTVYGFQSFLNIGGVIKFIPSTGVTLPLVSYGGSSLLSTFIMFAIIQGLYILKNDDDRKVSIENEHKRGRTLDEKRQRNRRE